MLSFHLVNFALPVVAAAAVRLGERGIARLEGKPAHKLMHWYIVTMGAWTVWAVGLLVAAGAVAEMAKGGTGFTAAVEPLVGLAAGWAVAAWLVRKQIKPLPDNV